MKYIVDIGREVANGITYMPDDTPEEAALRAKLVAEKVPEGMVEDFPRETLDLHLTPQQEADYQRFSDAWDKRREERDRAK